MTDATSAPPGTGPYKFDKVSQRRLELVPNQDYWEQDRVPKQDRLVLIPMPEGSTRTAASLSGQVDWIEAHSPDAITRLKVQQIGPVVGVNIGDAGTGPAHAREDIASSVMWRNGRA